jgi:hypothetical protein
MFQILQAWSCDNQPVEIEGVFTLSPDTVESTAHGNTRRQGRFSEDEKIAAAKRLWVCRNNPVKEQMQEEEQGHIYMYLRWKG